MNKLITIHEEMKFILSYDNNPGSKLSNGRHGQNE